MRCFSMIVLFTMILGFSNWSCSGPDFKPSIPSKKKMKIITENLELRVSPHYRWRYDVDNYKATKKNISSAAMNNCIKQFSFNNTLIEAIDQSEKTPYAQTEIISHASYNYYTVNVIAYIYDDSVSAKMALEILLNGSSGGVLKRSKECLLDICFNDWSGEPQQITHSFCLYGNIQVILSSIVNSDNYRKEHPVLDQSELLNIFKMNSDFLHKYSNDFERHLLNCKL